ncbi:MAG: ankyrin repeat domain-containing protein [Ekhidna sp.]
MLLSLFAFTSCESNSQETEEASNDAPKMTIHEAAFLGDVEALKAHIAAKTDLNQKDQFGSAPLTIAAIFGKPKVAKLLIEAGANLNIKSGDGSTPLHSAAFFCRKEIVQMLLDKGADTSARNNYGSTAMESIVGPFNEVKPFYDQVSRDLGPFGLKLDYAVIEETRPVIVEMIKASK